MTTLFENMLDNAIDQIYHSLPENYEVDDVSWSEEDDLFQIPVFDVSSIESSMRGAVDRFRFGRRAGETDEEVSERFVQELNRFCENW